jgi:hypothetical protein
MTKRDLHLTIADEPHFAVAKFQPVNIGSIPPGGFTQIFNRIIDSYAPDMSEIALRVYIYLARWADPRQGYKVEASQSKIASDTGLSIKSIQRACDELCDKIRCVERLQAGGSSLSTGKVSSIYQMLVPIDPPAGTLATPVRSDRGLFRPEPTQTPVSDQTVVQPDSSLASDRGLARPPVSNTNTKTINKRAADAAVVEVLRSMGIAGKNLQRLSETCILGQVQKVRRLMWLEQTINKNLINPSGWAISFLDGEIPLPDWSLHALKDATNDSNRRESLMITQQEYVKTMEQTISEIDDDKFCKLTCEVLSATQDEERRHHFLHNPSRTNFQLCEKVYFRIKSMKQQTVCH